MDRPLKILVVDDEPEARQLLKYMLQDEKELQLAGFAGSVDEAVLVTKRENPDLVILDIQMPGKDGFAFIDQVALEGYQPGIIFVTAYENYAIRAIRTAAFDYILKPVHREELVAAIQRYKYKLQSDRVQDFNRMMEMLRPSGAGKIKLNTRSGYILVSPSEVVYCKADGNYTHVQLLSGKMELITHNLGTIEELIGSGNFFRASRSYLVNINYLSRVDRKNCTCTLEYSDQVCDLKIPAQKIRLLEAGF